MLKALKCDFARIISSPIFCAAVIVTAVLCFSAQVYVDHSGGKAYSVTEAVLTFSRDFMADKYEFCPPFIIRQSLSGYSAMAMPVTASFPFVLSFISERNSGNMLYTVSRTSRRKYYLSKFIAAVISGGVCTVLGVILFGISVYVLFPNVTPELAEWAFPNGIFAALAKKLLSAFVYGMTSVLPAFFLCSFCTDPYIILCFPFMLKFITEAVLKKIYSNGLAAGNFDIFEQITPFYPDAASRLADRPVDKTFWVTLAVNVVFAAAVFAGFALIMENRSDRGR